VSGDLKKMAEKYGKEFYDLLKFSILIIPAPKYGLVFPEYFSEMKKVSEEINKEIGKKPFTEIVKEILPKLEEIERKYSEKLKKLFESKEEVMRKKLEELV